MVVSVQKGHENIKDQLRNLGHDVVTTGEYHKPVDAMVYVGSMYNDESINRSFQMMYAGISGESKGVLMINASNKSIAEIDKILRKRIYSPLF